MDMYTLLHAKWITSKALLVAHESMLSAMRQPGWEGVCGRMETCIWMAQILRCSSETITTLLISYILIEKLKKIKCITNKDLLESKGNYAQYLIST